MSFRDVPQKHAFRLQDIYLLSYANSVHNYKEGTPVERSSRVQSSNRVLAHDGNFRHYEFHYSRDARSPANPEYHEFMQSFQKLLHERDVANMFGLARYPGHDFEGTVEITEGRAKIKLHPKNV
jgi:hypothetical protein